MAIVYTAEQVLELAPDPQAAKAGRDLASQSKWQKLGQNGDAIWGECRGSGQNPYQTRADLSAPAFKCTCPSRKFPCKHSLALAILHGTSSNLFAQSEPPAWVSEWLTSRGARAQKKEKAESEKSEEQIEESLAAKDKRKQSRLSRVQSGIDELELFLLDLMRQGIGSIKKQPFTFWKSRSARLVDAQAPGLARLLTDCAEITARSTDWESALIDKLATINLICRAYKQIDTLSDELKIDVLTAIGINQSQEELLSGHSDKSARELSDLWLVVSQYAYTQDRLRVQKNWLWGTKSGQSALVLSFAHGTAPFDIMLICGMYYQADLVFYEGSLAERALIKDKTSVPDACPVIEGAASVSSALTNYANSLAKTPWLDKVPFFLRQVIPQRQSETNTKWWLVDEQGDALPLITKAEIGWQLLSYSGGEPISLFGEWDGNALKPLSAMRGTHFLKLHTVDA